MKNRAEMPQIIHGGAGLVNASGAPEVTLFAAARAAGGHIHHIRRVTENSS